LGRRPRTRVACFLAKAGARQQRRSSHSRVHPKATRPSGAAGTGAAGSASVQKISPPPAATRGTHCRPPRPPASLSLFAEEEEKKCSEIDLTPPRLHSRKLSSDRAPLSHELSETEMAAAVCCSAAFGATPTHTRRLALGPLVTIGRIRTDTAT